MIKILIWLAIVAIASGHILPSSIGHLSGNPLLIPPEEYGLPRIIGGDTAEPHAYPWQISLQLRQLGTFSHFCGGSVIDETTIVCGSHCVVGQVARSMQVV